MAKESVMVFCAHSDDQILGAGGTMAKYAKQGKDITTVIFSYGEMVPNLFLLQKKYSIERRVKEAQKADKIIAGSGVIFLGLTEGKFRDEIHEKDIIRRMAALIKDLRPKKIFTHNIDDPHPDHRAVRQILLDILYEMDYRCDVYAFQIWNPVKIARRNVPRLVVDISDTFKIKFEALKAFKSQFSASAFLNWFPLANVFFRDFMNGLNNNCRFAEIFYKLHVEHEINGKEETTNSK